MMNDDHFFRGRSRLDAASAPEGLAVVDRINRLAEACREAGILVIHTSYVLRPDSSNIGVLGEVNPAVKAGIITKGSESAALHLPGRIELSNAPQSIVNRRSHQRRPSVTSRSCLDVCWLRGA